MVAEPYGRLAGNSGEPGAYIQIGCGRDAPAGWLNFDASPRVLLPFGRAGMPGNVKLGNATRIPVPDETATCVFASHVYEHLARQDVPIALREAYRVLQPGGTLRLIVPDLQARAMLYLQWLREGRSAANDEFMQCTELGVVVSSRGLLSKFRRLFDHSRHKWMWDEPSMRALLREAGFKRIRRCDLGDSGDPMLELVERPDRFVSPRLGTKELAMEATK